MIQNRYLKTFLKGIVENNPIFVMILGICSTLGITNSVKNALVMSLSVGVTTIVCSWLVSLVRSRIPGHFRNLVYMLIISTVVIVLERFLRLRFPFIAGDLGPYLGLIITNCIIMGRCEAFALKNSPGLSVCDAAGVSLGYGMVLMTLSVVRELVGLGTIAGHAVFPASYQVNQFVVSAPGGFFGLALLTILFRKGLGLTAEQKPQ